MDKIACAVDLGGTKINTGLVREDGTVIKSVKMPTNAVEGPDCVMKRIKNSIHDVLELTGTSINEVCGIGVGSPGPIDTVNGLVISPSNFPGWGTVGIVDILDKEFGVPVVLNNDANCAALGEYYFGSGRGTKNFVYMTISTGIGGGIIVNGKLLTGANCNAGEIGHATIDFNGPRCKCGNYGCFEVFASGTALARFANEAVENGEDTIIKEIAKDEAINAEHVFEAYKKDDRVAVRLIEKEAFYIGIGISNIMMYYNPERIAIGGGMSNQWDVLNDMVLKTVRERTLEPILNACTISKAELGDNIGILGAAALLL